MYTNCRWKIYGKSFSILESSTLSLKHWIHLAYFWAHDCAGNRSVSVLGMIHTKVVTWSQRSRVCVMNCEAAHSDQKPFGGRDNNVEAEECGVGSKRKGLIVRDTDAKGDFRGIY